MSLLNKIFGGKKNTMAKATKTTEPKATTELFDSKSAIAEETTLFASIDCTPDNCSLIAQVLKKSTEFFTDSNRMPGTGTTTDTNK